MNLKLREDEMDMAKRQAIFDKLHNSKSYACNCNGALNRYLSCKIKNHWERITRFYFLKNVKKSEA